MHEPSSLLDLRLICSASARRAPHLPGFFLYRNTIWVKTGTNLASLYHVASGDRSSPTGLWARACGHAPALAEQLEIEMVPDKLLKTGDRLERCAQPGGFHAVELVQAEVV